MLTADAYGAGRGRRAARAGADRRRRARTTRLVGAVGHDFYEGERDGPRGFPRFTDPRAARRRTSTPATCGWRPSAASSGSAPPPSTCCCSTTPTASATPARRSGTGWRRCARPAWPARIGVAPGPANGFTLDLISCLERFGERIDWAMIILNPFEPWPGELCLDAAARHDVRVITRVVDYGGLFWGDLRPGDGAGRRATTAPSGPTGWIEAGLEKLERLLPDRRAGRADADPARLPVEPRPPGGRVRRPDPDPGGRAGGAARSRRSAPSWRRCRPSSGSPTRTSPRSARSATTPAAWR